MMIILADKIRFTPETKQNRTGEYRIEQRDANRSGKLTLPTGTYVKYSRYINRVGYALDSHSYTKEQWNEEGLNIVCNKTKLDKEVVGAVVKALNLHSPYKGLRGLIHQRLVMDKTKDFIRSMWFIDLTNTKQGQIVGRCRKLTGKYHHGGSYGSYYSGDFGYDPAYLDAVHQNLYLVANTDNGNVYMVHPEDIEQLSNGI